MIFIESELDNKPFQVVGKKSSVKVTETVKVTRSVNTVHTYESKSSDLEWDWEALRDYVVDRIEFFHGPFPRDFRKEKSIFSRFLKEFGTDAARIARFVFDGPAATGMWLGAPVSVNRFCRGSDDFFGRPILEKIGAA